ncbi:MAG: head-tail adaptor protein [Clostridia bacterium]|nr:head-tail adaptor protein [Clostridia bacterium]
MSLLEQAYENFILMNKIRRPDGYGGTDTVWEDGPTIKGALVMEDSTTALIAQAMGVTAVYTLTVRKSLELDFHDVLKREKDGKIFRITNDSDDIKTPASAGLDMRQYKAEAWTL